VRRIVSKRLGSRYRGGENRDWLKTKCLAAGRFIVTGFQELGPGRLEALHVAEETAGGLTPVGQVRFGFAGKGLWGRLDTLRAAPADKDRVVPIEPALTVQVKFFGRHKGGALRDGVLISVEEQPRPGLGAPWSRDSDKIFAAIDTEQN
jgi:ATP-dependent DNA ligase